MTLLLGMRRQRRRFTRPRTDQHSIALDAPVPGLVAQVQNLNSGEITNVPVTYETLGEIKALEMDHWDRRFASAGERLAAERRADPRYRWK